MENYVRLQANFKFLIYLFQIWKWLNEDLDTIVQNFHHNNFHEIKCDPIQETSHISESKKRKIELKRNT